MLYGVNTSELGINETLQIIELTLGEGDSLKYIYQMFYLWFRYHEII